MKHNAIVALLLAASTLLSVGCNKDEENNAPKAKVSRVYVTTSLVVENYNDSTGVWDTSINLQGSRDLRYELFWTGDRLDSLHEGSYDIVFTFDDEGRPVTTDSRNYSMFETYEYDAEGRLSHSNLVLLNSTRTDTTYVVNRDLVWRDNKIQKEENDVIVKDASYQMEGTRKEAFLYSWTGDNITSFDRQALYFNNSRDTLSFNVEYTNLANPLYGHVFFQLHDNYMFNYDAPAEGLCKKMPSRVFGNNRGTTYEYTTSGGRITAIRVVSTSLASAGVGRATSISEFELEYED